MIFSWTQSSIYLCYPLSLLSCSVFYPPSVCLSVSAPLPPHSSWLTWVGETGQFVLPGSKITCLSVWMWKSTDDFCTPISNHGSYRSNKIKISIVCLALYPEETLWTVGVISWNIKVVCISLLPQRTKIERPLQTEKEELQELTK